MEITVLKDNYKPYTGTKEITIYNMTVKHPEEIPVLTGTDIPINVESRVYPDESGEEIATPIIGANVVLRSTDVDVSGITNASGYIGSIDKTAYTTPISLTVTKDRYRTYEGLIMPYMWSTTNEALGTNNQTHIVRKPETNEISIVYSDGDSIIYGSSYDFGNIWHLEKIGAGVYSTIVKRTNGVTVLWQSGLNEISYSEKSSPWTPVDTVIQHLMSVSEPVLTRHPSPDNDSLFASIIEYRSWPPTSGDFILATWNNQGLETATFDTIVPYTGDEEDEYIIPLKSPLVGKYLPVNQYVNLIGFTSTNNQLMVKLQDPFIYNYFRPTLISITDQIVASPSLDVYGNTTTFIWTADNGTSSEIWKRKLIGGILTDAERIDDVTGINTNPKIKDNYINSFTNDSKRIISKPGLFKDNDYSVVVEADDSLQGFDMIVKNALYEGTACYFWSEGQNGIYRIKTAKKVYDIIASPKIITQPTDTVVGYINDSPIYDYVSGRPFIERLTYDAVAMDTFLDYDVMVVVSQANPVRPQILMFDTLIVDVIYGTPSSPDTLQYTVPKELYNDGELLITLDRLKGNPNRTSEIAIYEYEFDENTETVAAENKIKKIKLKLQEPANQFEYYLSSGLVGNNGTIYFSISNQGPVSMNIFDISGRFVQNIVSGSFNPGNHNVSIPNHLSSGVYFVKMETGGMTFTEKLIKIK